MYYDTIGVVHLAGVEHLAGWSIIVGIWIAGVEHLAGWSIIIGTLIGVGLEVVRLATKNTACSYQLW